MCLLLQHDDDALFCLFPGGFVSVLPSSLFSRSLTSRPSRLYTLMPPFSFLRRRNTGTHVHTKKKGALCQVSRTVRSPANDVGTPRSIALCIFAAILLLVAPLPFSFAYAGLLAQYGAVSVYTTAHIKQMTEDMEKSKVGKHMM